MTMKTQEEINFEKIISSSSNFQTAYEELRILLRQNVHYKGLVNSGESSFLNAPLESEFENNYSTSFINTAKVNLFSSQLDDDIEELIKEKLQGDFRRKFKEEALKTVLNLSSKQKNSVQILVPASKSQTKIVKNAKKMPPKFEDLNKYYVQNICDIWAQATAESEEFELISIENSKEILSNDIKQKRLDLSDSDCNLSASSVHTSDLSSFETELVLISDEETVSSRKSIALKEIPEALDKSRTNLLKMKEDYGQFEDACVKEDTITGKQESKILPKSQRIRKPNSKYSIYDDIDDVFLYKRKWMEKKIPKNKMSVSSQASAKSSDVPRKRGRPRKHHHLYED